ncbi:MAG TPA: hypothetical protein VLJ58_14290 [Ramlibacter sp.]|nr:hypothetical protein [Ramlibacter sp.]
MDELITLLVAPAMLVGVVGGLVVALLFHWLAPAGTDTVSAGAWFVVIGGAAGLLWQMLVRKEKN